MSAFFREWNNGTEKGIKSNWIREALSKENNENKKDFKDYLEDEMGVFHHNSTLNCQNGYFKIET